MYRNLAIAGATVVALAGVGTAALAASGSDSTSGSGSTSSHAAHDKNGKNGKKHSLRAMLRHGVHASIVTKSKDGYVAHSAIRGRVTSVSATSITVKASDGYSETFTVGKDTKVRAVSGAKGSRKAATSTISKVKSGDAVFALGKAAEASHANPTATAVIDGVRLTK